MPSTDPKNTRRMTVMLCDLVGSTGLSERFDPEDLREILRDYQAASVAAIERFGGLTAQYLGDGILCYFGDPEPRQDDADRAVRAGLDIVAAIEALNRRRASEWGTRLAVRIGIHSGTVATRTLERSRPLYGPTPEIAERLQRLAEPNGVAVSGATCQLIEETFDFHPIGRIESTSRPIEVFQVATDAPATEIAESADEGQAEYRQLTVMFCELIQQVGDHEEEDAWIAGSTEIDLASLSANLSRFQTTCATVVERLGGHIAQYLGEGLMVYFGYPIAHEDDAQRAVHAGLGILEVVDQLAETVGKDNRMAVRIGLHTGPVVAGEVGAGETREKLALGSTPNIAARVQSLARQGELVLSQTTQQLVSGFFVLESRGSHRVKGISEPIELFLAVEESGVRNPFEVALSRGLTPLEGRRKELAVLLGCLQRAQEGQAQAAMIHGEAGIGKSRLLYALVEHATGTTQWTCRCSPYAQGSPLEPLIDLLQRVVELDREKPETRARKLEQFLDRYEMLSDEAVSLLAGLLSVQLPARYPPLNQTPQRQRQRTLELIRDVFLHEALERPLLFIVEDIHWIDPSTQEFLDLLVQRPEGRMLTVLAFRPSYDVPWSSPPVPLTGIELDRLDQSEAIKIIRHFTGGKALPTAVERQVVERADGIPLFIEELTRMVLDSEALAEDETSYRLIGPLSALAIPSSVHDLLTARLDRLSTSRELVQWGAVIGRDFTHEMLLAVCELDPETLQERLAQVIDSGLVVCEGTAPQAVYIFKHALIQDAAYASLLRRQRRNYHGRVATVLTESFSETVEQRPQIVAFHFTQAQQPEPAIDFWQLAGQRDFQRAAFPEAVNHLEQGLDLLENLKPGSDRDQRELALQAALGSVHSSTQGFGATAVETSFARAFTICQRIGDVPQLFWVLFGLWRFHFMRANYNRALELAEQLKRLATSAPSEGHERDPSRLLAAHFTVGATLHCRGQFTAALEQLERAIAIGRHERVEHDAAQTGQDSGVASLCWAAMTQYFLGYPDRARRLCDEAVELAKDIGHAFTQTYALCVSGFVAYYCRDHQSLSELFDQVIEQARAQGSWWEANADTFFGWSQADRPRLLRGLEAHLATGARMQRPQIYAALAEVALRQKDVEQARQDLDLAQAAIDETGELYYAAEVLRIRGEADLLEGRDGSRRAAEQFRRSLALAGEQENRAIALRATISLCHVLQAENRTDEARDLLTRAHGELTEGFDTHDFQDARELLEAFDQQPGVTV